MVANGFDAESRAAIASLDCGEVRFDESLSRHTTLKMGGPADAWVAPTSVDGVSALCKLAKQKRWPIWSLGGGSNLLVKDGGVRGITLSTRKLRGLSRVGELGIYVEAGVSTGKLLSSALNWELGGIEFLGGVPGSVGGGLVMNAGTYLGEFVEVTTWVESIRFDDGKKIRRTNAECGFRYRGSDLPRDELIVAAQLDLVSRPKSDMQAVIRALKDRRKEREPHKVSNAGSVFKNPDGDYAGRLLEEAGLKGTMVGAAQCTEVHANWFVNTGGASSRDMLALIELARRKVREVHGVELTLEWKIVGEEV